MAGSLPNCLNTFKLDSEILAGECLTELPVGRSDVPGGGSPAVTSGDSEGEGLAHQDSIRLPVLTPVPAHAHPTGSSSFHANPHDITCTRDVGDQNQVEVSEAVDREPDPASLPARHPFPCFD